MAAAAPKRSPEEVRARRKLERTIGRKLPELFHCSFCAKPQTQVEKLIAGPWTFICNECVGLCDRIIVRIQPAVGGQPATAVPARRSP